MVRKRKGTYIKKIWSLLMLFLFLHNHRALAQMDKKDTLNHFEQAAALYHSKQLSSKQYLDTCFMIANQYLAQGIAFKGEQLIKTLSPYYKIAFEEQWAKNYKAKYYLILANNAQWSNRDGESLYYFDKIAALNDKTNEKNTDIIARKMQYYVDRKLYEKAAGIYKGNIDLIDKRIQYLLDSPKISVDEINVFYLLNFSAFTFAELKDSIMLNKIAIQSEACKKVFLAKVKLNDEDLPVLIQLTASIKLYKAQILEEDYDKAQAVILGCENEFRQKVKTQNAWTKIFQNNIDNFKATIFLLKKEHDSAAVYLDKIYQNSVISDGLKTDQYKLLAQLHEGQKNYYQAMEDLKKIIDFQDNIIVSRKEEQDELLYAFTESEFNKMELEKSKSKNKKKALSIMLISSSAVLLLLLFYLRMRKKEKTAQERIERLDYIANLQIAELEESKTRELQEMQENLGRDLHDGLSALVAGIKNKVEYLQIDTQEAAVRTALKDIGYNLEEVYKTIRTKSHDLFEKGNENAEWQFERKIRSFTDSSMPDSHFEKHILIDEGAIEHLNIDQRINLLKMIQEAIANIIKHANASKLSLLIYAEDANMQLCIEDNGKGFNIGRQKEGLGLQSIRKRVAQMEGKLQLSSSEKGTSINISIPLQTIS